MTGEAAHRAALNFTVHNQIRLLWWKHHDTQEIADMLKMPEYKIYNLLHAMRESGQLRRNGKTT